LTSDKGNGIRGVDTATGVALKFARRSFSVGTTRSVELRMSKAGFAVNVTITA
jgi:hypothetical protein